MFGDIVDLGKRIMADFTAGKYASLSHDVGQGFNLLGDVLHNLFGFQGQANSTDDETKVNEFITEAEQFVSSQKHNTVGGPSPKGFDPTKIMAAFEVFLSAFKAIWNLFHPTTTQALKS